MWEECSCELELTILVVDLQSLEIRTSEGKYRTFVVDIVDWSDEMVYVVRWNSGNGYT